MNIEKTLEQKMREIEAKMPGIRGELHSVYECSPGSSFRCDLVNLEYGETDSYQIVVASWESEEWAEEWHNTLPYGASTQFSAAISVYCRKKGEKEYQGMIFDKAVTRHTGPQLEKKYELWVYKLAYLELVVSDRIIIGWADEEGHIQRKKELTLPLE